MMMMVSFISKPYTLRVPRFRAVGARTATGIRAGALVVIGHAVSKSWEVNNNIASGEGKSTARSASSPHGSA